MAITTQIQHYPSAHGKGEGGGGGTTIIMGGNGTGNIGANLNVTSINAVNGNITNLTGGSLTFNDGQFIYIGASNGTVQKIKGDRLEYNWGKIKDFYADTATVGKLKADEIEAVNAWLDNINSKNITTEYLTVTRQAHFFELVIDKIRSVGGQMILTAANCIADYVKAVDSNGNYLANLDDQNAASYDIFFRANDENSGRAITNDWVVNDQAICQSFNNVSPGVNYNVSNKYYWRLVTQILSDRYMNLSTGATTTDASVATVNTVSISNPSISLTDLSGTTQTISTDWNTAAQTIPGIITGAGWSQTSGGSGQATIGTMTTTNTVFGIQMTPVSNSTLSLSTPKTFSVTCSAARLNIGIYYTDGSSQFFVAPETATTSYSLTLSSDYPIEAVVITNADEVEWHLVHGIRLSNTDCDNMLSGYSSIPSIGDNIVQLGYRWGGAGDTNEKSRGNAIIIAAYKTIDNGTGDSHDLYNRYPIVPPSYAQYEYIASNASHRFDLAYYRQTYMDANGSIFRGKFIASDGVNIEDKIEAGEADLWELFQAYAHDDGNGHPDSTSWQKAPVTGSWEWWGTRSEPVTIQSGETRAEAIARVEATLVFSDYSWSTIPSGSGTTGRNGQYTQWAYKNSATTPQKPVSNSTYPPTGWSVTATTPNFANGEYTWCITRDISYNSSNQEILGQWCNPYRITGDNGQPGEDGKWVEFIYKHFAGPQSWSENNDNPAYWAENQTPDYTGPQGYQWTDNPTGVSNEYKYEYVAEREYDGTSYGKFKTPALWSKYGEKGQDGDGYEYIYKHFTQEQNWGELLGDDNPANWPANQGSGEYLGPTGYEWSDDPVGVSSVYKYEYVSVRKRTAGVWAPYSTPSLWSRYASQGSNGGHYEFLYKNAQTNPGQIPSGTTKQQLINQGWSVTATTPDFANGYYTWYTYAFVSGEGEYGDWIYPARMTGDNGQPGEDGDSVEFIYMHFTEEQNWNEIYDNRNPYYWPISQDTDYLGPTGYEWSDNPLGISSTYKFEYMSQREFKYQTAGAQNKTWDDFTVPVLWSNWGEKGQDGDGYEYVFKAFGNEQNWDEILDNRNPYYWPISQNNEYLGPTGYEWSDDPVELNSTTAKVEYVAMRKKSFNGAQGVSLWDNYSKPEIWAMYGGTGPEGPQGPQGNPGIQGLDGVDAVVYKLIDWGSQAYYSIALDASNNVVSSIAFRLKFKVAKVIGTDTTFLTGQDIQFWADDTMQIVGLWPYAKFSKTATSTNVVYKWYKFSFASQADYNDGICTLEWIPDWTETQIKNATLNNPSISVGLIPSSTNELSEDASAVEDMKDKVEVPVIMAANAQWQVNGDIKGLVTGQQGINQNISSLTIGVQGIQTNVSSLQTQMDEFEDAGYVDQSTLTQTASMIKAEVVSTYNNADGLAYNTVIDLISYDDNGTTKYYDETTFYPVSVSLPWTYTYYDEASETWKTVKGQKQRVIVTRFLDSTYGVPDYASNQNGFVFKFDFVTVANGSNGAWIYDSSKYRYGEPLFINRLETEYTISQAYSPNPYDIPNIPAGLVVGSIRQNYVSSYNPGGTTNSGYNDEVFYLRGGSKYNISTSHKDSKSYVWRTGYNYGPLRCLPITDWRDLVQLEQDEMTRSEIVQTANNIQLNVYDNLYNQTGIDISAGKITLDAENTIIDGDLNITNANEGLQIYDNGTPKVSILNRNIGTDPTAVTDYKTVVYEDSIVLSPGDYEFDFSPATLALGTFANNTTVTLSGFKWQLSTYISDDDSIYRASNVIDSASLNLVYTGPGSISGSQTATGTISGLNTSYTANGSANSISFSDISGEVTGNGITKYCWIKLKIIGKVNYVNTSGVLIGKDGLSVQSTTGNIYTWLCSDSAIIRNGDSIFRMKNGHIERNDQKFTTAGRTNTEMGGTIFGDISSVMPVKIVNTANYSATNYDCFIVVSTYLGSTSATRTITLPAPNATPIGKKYYIKNISPNPCNVTTVTDGLMEPDGTSLSTSMSVANKSMMFISDGTEYIMYYCA